MRIVLVALALLVCVALCVAQDPAPGWLSFAAGVNPAGTGIITKAEAKWKVGALPAVGGAFYSPWLGIESSDNLNLIQPVNPFDGQEWLMYNEYYQWSPTNNIDSDQHTCQPGDVLHGVVTYSPSDNSYNMVHTNLNDGWSVTTNIPIQTDPNTGALKNFTIVYLVFEKDADCNQYPADGSVTFFDINVEYDNKPTQMLWKTGIVDDVCNNRAHILNQTTIQITWDTQAANPVRRGERTRSLGGGGGRRALIEL